MAARPEEASLLEEQNLKESPFIELGCPFTAYEAFKMVLLLPLLPIRFVLGGSALVAIAVINSIAAWHWPADKPLTPWRRRIVLLSKELVLVTLWCIGFRIRVKGCEHIRLAERFGAVGVFNHISWVDAFVLVWLMAPSGVSKADNAKLPVIRHAVRALQTVYIPYDRLSRRHKLAAATATAESNSAGQSHEAPLKPSDGVTNGPNGASVNVIEGAGGATTSTNGGANGAFLVSTKVTEVLSHRVRHPSYCKPGGYPMVVLAPEGTTGSGRGLLAFRTGAFVLGRPVLPICFRYRWRALNPAWTLGNARWHFVRLMCQFVNDCEVDILPPYRPSQAELQNPRLYAENVRRLMASCLEAPLLEASHDDYLHLRRLGVTVSWDGRRLIVPDRAEKSQ